MCVLHTKPRAPDFKRKLTEESPWMDGWYSPSWVSDRLRLEITEEPSAIEGMHKAQADEEEEEEVNSNTGSGWRMLSLEETPPSLKDGLLPQLSVEDFARILLNCRKERDQVQMPAHALRLHAHMCENGLEAHRSLGNYLIPLLVEVGSMYDAQRVFDRLLYRNKWSWNSLITGYIKCGKPRHAFNLYQKMQEDGSVHASGHTFVALLKACAKLKDLERGLEIHAKVSRRGLLERDLFVCSTLIDMYAKCGSLVKAHEVFDKLPVRDVVSWTALISGYAEHGQGEEALKCFEQMQLEGVSPDAVTFVCSLKACGIIGAIDKGREIHVKAARTGLRDIFLGSTLVDMYTKFGLLAKAQQVFDKLPNRDVVSWTALITGYVEHGQGEEALMCFEQMQLEGVSPDAITLVCSLKACGSIGATDKGREIHAKVAKMGLLERDLVVANTLVDMYGKCDLLAKAQQVFDKLLIRDVVSWTALIAGYAEHGHGEEALKLFEQMQLEGLSPNAVTYVCILKACGSIGATDKGQAIHAEVERKGLVEIDLVRTALVDMYAKCGSLARAQQVFDKLPARDVVSWTALIAGYAEHGSGEEALRCFEQMRLERVSPSAVTFLCSLKACGSIGATDKGREIHDEIERRGLLERNIVVGTALVDMYAKCGVLAKAQEVFDKLQARDVVSWNSLISGYAEHGHGEEALKCFEQMQLEGVSPDAVTFLCSLNACGSIGAADKGREIHAEVERRGLLERDLVVGTTLVDMYAKCGLFVKAREVFEKLPVRNVVLWNSLMAGYAEHGHGEEALKCLEQMNLEGISPDPVTFVCSLKACCSIGTTDKGGKIYAEVEREGLLEGDLVVGNTYVDIHAKCGLLAIAQQVFDKLSVRDVVSWTALITGYAKHGHDEEALKCFEQMQLEGVSPNAVTFVCSLKACGSMGATDKGREIHAEIERKGLFETDPLVGNTLVHMYGKCGSLAIAQQVFDKLPVRDVVSWTALIAGYAEHGHGEEALKCLEEMQLEGVSPDAVAFVCCLKACGSIGASGKGEEIHAEIGRKGLLERDLVVGTTLVAMYAKCGTLGRAQEVFDKLPVRDIVAWTALIAGYAEHGHGEEALQCFEKMQLEGVSPDAATFVCSLKACGSIGAKDKGREIHSQIERMGLLERNLVVGTTLVVMYAKCGMLAIAQQVFDKLSVRDIVLWTALMTGYAERGHGEEALKCFEQMQLEGFSPNAVTFVCSLRICARIGARNKGQEIHAELERKGLLERDLVGNTLVDMYAKCGSLDIARQFFDELPFQDVVSWTTLIAGYAEHGHGEEALKCFERMQLEGVSPDAATFVCSLKACGSIGATDKGREIHAEVERMGLLERGLVVGTTLVDMYAKCGTLAKAQEVFDKLPVRDVVSWTALIVGYAEHGHGEEALECFEQMRLEGVSPDAVTLVCTLKACSSIGVTDKGREIHAEIERKGLLERDLVVGNTLVNMYAKSGLLSIALQVFDMLPVRDIVSWNSLMAGYARLGESEKVFRIFDRMLGEGVKPDPVTFIIALNACSRTGSYKKSQTYFEAMSKDFDIVPFPEHHTGMVDLLCRVGQLDKAVAMIKKMPLCSNLVVWHTVLGACRNCGNVELGKQAFEQAIRLDEKDSAAYVLMSHIYADAETQEK